MNKSSKSDQESAKGGLKRQPRAQRGAWKDREVSIFPPLFDTFEDEKNKRRRVPKGKRTLEELSNAIRENEDLKADTKQYLDALADGVEKGYAKKDLLHSASLCGTFDRLVKQPDEKTGHAGLLKGSGIVQIDLDDVPEDKKEQCRVALQNWGSALAVWDSPTQTGLKAAVAVEGVPLTNEEAKAAFEAAQGALPEVCRKYVDSTTSNINRELFLSHAPNLWFYAEHKDEDEVVPVVWTMEAGWDAGTILQDAIRRASRPGESRHKWGTWLACDLMRHGHTDQGVITDVMADYRTAVDPLKRDGFRHDEVAEIIQWALGEYEDNGVGDPWRRPAPEKVGGRLNEMVEAGREINHQEAARMCVGMTDAQVADAVPALGKLVPAFSKRAFNAELKRLRIKRRERNREAAKGRGEYYIDSFNEKTGDSFTEIVPGAIAAFMEKKGFFKTRLSDEDATFIYWRKNPYTHWIEHHSLESMRTFLSEDARKADPEEEVWKALVSKPKTNLAKELFEAVEVREIKGVDRTKPETWLYYNNTAVLVTADGPKGVAYEEVPHDVFAGAVMDRHYDKDGDRELSDFWNFHGRIMSGEVDRMQHYRKALGYLMCSQRSADGNRVVVFQDRFLSAGADGGTGKSIAVQAIAKMVSLRVIPAENIDFNERYVFSRVVPGVDQVIAFDDAMSSFELSALYSATTLGMEVRKRWAHDVFIPLEELPRIMLTTNRSVTVRGVSDERRTVFVEVDDYFNLKRTPLSEYGKLLFGPKWTKEDWGHFDAMMISCISEYLANPLWDDAPATADATWKQVANKTSYEFAVWAREYNWQAYKVYDTNDLYEDFNDTASTEVGTNNFSRWLNKAANLIAKSIEKRIKQEQEGSPDDSEEPRKSSGDPPAFYKKRKGKGAGKQRLCWFGDSEMPD